MTTTTRLDPRFAKIIAKMRSTTHAGERDAARGLAAVVAGRCGLTPDQALAELDGRPTGPAARAPFQDAHDDFHRDGLRRKAEKRARQSEQARFWRDLRTATLAKYGSAEVALAPSAKEQALREAMRRLPTTLRDPPHPSLPF